MPIAEIESIFDTLFAPQRNDLASGNINGNATAPMTHMVQIYGSDQDM